MSPIVGTEAVVLRAVKFQESSRIVTFYTERLGRVAGIVKGARRSPARYAASLQPMSHVSVVIHRKPGREVQTVSQCDLVAARRRIPEDLGRLTIGLQMVEVVTLVTHPEEEHRDLFLLLRDSLARLDGDPDPGWPLYYGFLLRLAAALGFATGLGRCPVCGAPAEEGIGGGRSVRLDVERGGPLCPRCDLPGRRGVLLPPGDFILLRGLEPAGVAARDAGPAAGDAAASGVPADGERRERIEQFLHEYFSFHVPGFRRPRSGEVFRRLGAEDLRRR